MMRLPLLFAALQLMAGCRAACTQVRVTVLTDNYPGDTSWKLTRKGKTKMSDSLENGEKNQEHVQIKCLRRSGEYQFTISDKVGNGVCCQEGDGFYKVETKSGRRWHVLLSGGKFRHEESSRVWIGKNYGRNIVKKMTWWEKSLLDAHNWRREQYHGGWDTDYVPLKWSPELAKRSQAYAHVSADECKDGIPAQHGEQQEYGENVLGTKGSSNSAYSKFKSANGYLKQFVERESNWEWPRNGHESMAMWRATQYVGCANATTHWESGNNEIICHRVVCRYAKPGNCKAGKPFNWTQEAMKDNTACGPMCPPEGCFHANAVPEPSTPYPEGQYLE